MGNLARDERNVEALKKAGWKVLVVWECWLKDTLSLEARLLNYLQEPVK
jgi:G:T-mismatch repair DNA endonuclease (very short patch repair protein)